MNVWVRSERMGNFYKFWQFYWTKKKKIGERKRFRRKSNVSHEAFAIRLHLKFKTRPIRSNGSSFKLLKNFLVRRARIKKKTKKRRRKNNSIKKKKKNRENSANSLVKMKPMHFIRLLIATNVVGIWITQYLFNYVRLSLDSCQNSYRRLLIAKYGSQIKPLKARVNLQNSERLYLFLWRWNRQSFHFWTSNIKPKRKKKKRVIHLFFHPFAT